MKKHSVNVSIAKRRKSNSPPLRAIEKSTGLFFIPIQRAFAHASRFLFSANLWLSEQPLAVPSLFSPTLKKKREEKRRSAALRRRHCLSIETSNVWITNSGVRLSLCFELRLQGEFDDFSGTQAFFSFFVTALNFSFASFLLFQDKRNRRKKFYVLIYTALCRFQIIFNRAAIISF